MLVTLHPALLFCFAFCVADHSSKSFTSPWYLLEFKCAVMNALTVMVWAQRGCAWCLFNWSHPCRNLLFIGLCPHSPLSHYLHADDLSLTELRMFHTFCSSGILAAITKHLHMYTRVHAIIGYITFERQCNSLPRKQKQATAPCPTLQGIFSQRHATAPQPEKANPLVNQEGSELRPPVNALSCQCIHELHWWNTYRKHTRYQYLTIVWQRLIILWWLKELMQQLSNYVAPIES